MNEQVSPGLIVEIAEGGKIVGFVAVATGGALGAQSTNGAQLTLSVGSPILEGYVLSSSSEGQYLVILQDGTVRELPRMGLFQATAGALQSLPIVDVQTPGFDSFLADLGQGGAGVTEMLLSAARGEAVDGQGLSADAKELLAKTGLNADSPEFLDLLAALEAGKDIGELLQPTAAGEESATPAPQTGESIQSPTEFQFLNPQVTPVAGIDPDLGFALRPLPTADTSLSTDDSPMPNPDFVEFIPTPTDGLVVEGGGSFTSSVIDNDTFGSDGPGTPPVVAVNGSSTNVGQPITGSLGGTIIINADGTYTYTPPANVDHSDNIPDEEVFEYTVQDGNGTQASTTLTVVIADTVPTAVDDAANVPEDTAIVINVFANDDPGADGVNLVSGVGLTTPPSKGSATYNADGTFTYTPNPGAEGADSFTYTITDTDGDPSTATVTLNIAPDSTPTVATPDVNGDGDLVWESALPSGSGGGTTTTSGSFVINTGNDSLALLEVQDVNGNWIAITTNGTTVEGQYGLLSVNTDGSWSYEITDNTEDHPDFVFNDGDGDRNHADQVTDPFQVRVTDSDGDLSPEATLTVAINDDGPTAVDDGIVPVAEDSSVVINAFVNDVFGADGVDIDNSPSVAVTHTQPSKGSVSYDAQTGLFTYVANSGSEGADSFTYTIIDGDGDKSTAVVTLNIGGDSEPVVSTPGGVVWESALPDGSGGGTTTTSGDMIINTGNDDLALIEVKDVNGSWIEINADGTAVQGQYGILTVNTDGSWTYEITDNTEDHPDFVFDDGDGDRDFDDPIVDPFQVRVTDSDGDISPESTLNISVLDDGPTAIADFVQGQEDQTVTYNVITNNDGTSDIQGADGATLTEASINTGLGSLSFLPNGEITYTPGPGESGLILIDYTITDADGDISSTTLTIAFPSDSEPFAGATAASVDDDGLAGPPAGNPASTAGDLVVPNTDGDNNESTFSGTLVHNFGGDGPGTIDFAAMDGQSATVGQESVNFSWAGNTLTATIAGGDRNGVDLFTVTVTNASTGAYSIVLLTNVIHETLDGLPGDNTENDASVALTFTVSDADNTTANGVLTITFDDDMPSAAQITTNQAEEDQPVVVDVLSGANEGADGAELLSATLNTGLGSLGFTPDGVITYTQAPGEGGQVSITYTLIDSDGDEVSNTLLINLAVDAVPTAGTTNASVDDDGLAGPPAGNPVSTQGDLAVPNDDGDNNESTFGGTLVHNFGGDGAGGIDFAAMHGQSATIGQETINFSWNAGTNTLTGTGPRGALFTVQVTPATGAYTVTLLDNVLHETLNSLPGDDTENDATVALTYTVTDSDNSTANGTLNITFDDDMPSVSGLPGQPETIDEETSTGGTWSLTEGADGATVSITVGNDTLSLATDGSVEFDLAEGTLTVYGQDHAEFAGEWAFTANNLTASDSVTFTISAEDADGDLATDTHTINITDGAGVQGGDTVSLTVYEAALDTDADGDDDSNDLLAGNVTGSDPDALTETATSGATDMQFTAGATDAITGIAFVDPLDAGFVAPVVQDEDASTISMTWELSGGQLLGKIGGTTAIVLALSGDTAGVAAGATANIAVKVTLTDAFPHSEFTVADTVSITGVQVQATDEDGSTALGYVNVDIVDDLPGVSGLPADPESINEESSTSGTWNTDVGADSVGASFAVSVVGESPQTLSDTGSVVFNTSAGDLTVYGQNHATKAGQWEFDANNVGQSGDSITFTISATDGDDDVGSDTHTINVTDPGSVSGGDSVTISVYEAALDTALTGDDDSGDIIAGNVTGTTPNALTETYLTTGTENILFQAGSTDAITSIVFDLTGGNPVVEDADNQTIAMTWSVNGSGQLEGSLDGGTTVAIILEIVGPTTAAAGAQANVAVKATLTDAFPHSEFTQSDTVTIQGITLLATDSDGSTATGTVNVNVIDDLPSVGGLPASAETINEEGTANGAWTLNMGADIDGSKVEVTVGATTKTLPSGGSVQFAETEGTLTVYAQDHATKAGQWEFTANELTSSDSLSFSIKATDGDLDVATDTHTINITDGTGVTGGDSVTLTVYEAALDTALTGDNDSGDIIAGNVTGTTPNALTETTQTSGSDNLAFTANATDAITTIAFDISTAPVVKDADNNTIAVNWTVNGSGQLEGRIGGDLAIILALSGDTGAVAGGTANVVVKVTLTDAFPHSEFTQADTVAITGIAVKATDEDGDSATGTVNVNVIDDVPSVGGLPASAETINEEGTANGTWTLNMGADIDGSKVEVTVGATTKTLASGGSVQFAETEGTLTLYAQDHATKAGQWEFTANELTSSDSLSFTIKATDGDLDVATDTHTINITDGTGVTGGDSVTLTVYEAALDTTKDSQDIIAGNVTGTTPNALTETTQTSGTDNLAFTANATDAITTIAFDISTAPVVKDADNNTIAVNWTVNGSGQLEGRIGGDLAIILALSGDTGAVAGGTANVVVKVTLTDAFPHSEFTQADTVAITGIAVKATDEDGDSATGTVNVNVIDDLPLFTLINDGPDPDDIISISAPNPATSATYTGQFADWKVGADGFQSVGITTSDNVTILSQSATQIVLSIDDGLATLTLNADGNDSIAVTHRDSEIGFIPEADFTATAAGPTGQYLLDLADPPLRVIITGDDGDAIAEPTTDDAVNTSTQGWAVKGGNGQTMQNGESLLFTFAVNEPGFPTRFVDDFKFHLQGFTGGLSADAQVLVTVYTNAAHTTSLTQVLSLDALEVVQISEDVAGFTPGTEVYGVKIQSQETDGSFRINGIEIGTVTETLPDDLDFNFTLSNLSDGDGDVASQSFSVHLDGDSTPANLVLEAVVGTSGNDILTGTSSPDLIIGGPGSDTMNGDAAADIFMWFEGDAVGGATDITDFNPAEGDVLDIGDLLVGEDALNHSTDALLAADLVSNGYIGVTLAASATMTIDTNGAAAGGDIQTINLTGYDTSGFASQAAVIESLLSGNNLLVD